MPSPHSCRASLVDLGYARRRSCEHLQDKFHGFSTTRCVEFAFCCVHLRHLRISQSKLEIEKPKAKKLMATVRKARLCIRLPACCRLVSNERPPSYQGGALSWWRWLRSTA